MVPLDGSHVGEGVIGDGDTLAAHVGDGAAEQYIKEGKLALRWARLSCHAFRHNAVRLQLFALAYNLANFLRSLALPREIESWSLTTLREKLIKIGARIVRHGRYVVFQLAEAGTVRRDPAPDRSAAAALTTAPGMSIARNDRWRPSRRGASMLDRDRPKAAVKRAASLIMRLGAMSRAGSCRRRLAERDVTTQRRPPKDGHPENPGL